MSLDLTDDQSTLVQVMAWCSQATSHYLSQCWPRSLSPYGVTRPQWVKFIEENMPHQGFFSLYDWAKSQPIRYLLILAKTLFSYRQKTVVISRSMANCFLWNSHRRASYCYRILHMPRQHSYHTMCQISKQLPESLYHNLDECRMKFPSLNHSWNGPPVSLSVGMIYCSVWWSKNKSRLL